MEEIYASAKGKGTKDRLRILIDLDVARTSSIGELAGLLDSHGITLTLRGGSVTFIDRATGRKFRGSRLGEAYSLDAIGARLMDCGSMLHLTFNNKLVAAVNDRTISVWLPGTKRRRKVNLPVGMLRRDGEHMASAHAGNVHRHGHGPREQVRGALQRGHAGGRVRRAGAAARTPRIGRAHGRRSGMRRARRRPTTTGSRPESSTS